MAKQIKVELAVKDSGTKTVKKFSDSTSSALKKLAGPLAVGAVTAAFTTLVKKTADYGDKLHKLNLQLGISVENLDKMKRVGDLAGVSLDQITTSIRVMSRNLNDAADGTGLAKDALKELGLNAEELLNMNPDQAFVKIAEALQEVENPTKRAALAMDTMGRSGTVVIQMSKDLQKELDNTNTKWNQSRADQSAYLKDTLTNMKTSLEDLAVEVLPAVVKAVEAMTEVFKGADAIYRAFFENVTKSHKDWIQAGDEALTLTKRMVEIEAALRDSKFVLDEWGDGLDEIDTEPLRMELGWIIQELRRIKAEGKAATDAVKGLETMKPGQTRTIEPLEKMDVPESDFDKRLKAELEASKARRAEEQTFLIEVLPAWNQESLDKQAEQQAEHEEKMKQLKLDALNEYIKNMKERQAEQKRMMEEMGMFIVENMVNPLIEAAVTTGDYKEAFKQMAVSVLQWLAKMIIMLAIKRALESYGGGFGGGGGVPYIPALAEGGIFKGGIQAFAGGGVATKPTLGLIGEGGLNEAVVPLPDGRSIPVEMQGGDKKSDQPLSVFISAVDAKSFVELTRRNPEAIVRPIIEAIESGNQGLRSNLKKAVNR